MKKLFIYFIFMFLVNVVYADVFSKVFNYSHKDTYHKLLAAIGQIEKDFSGLYISENTEKKISLMFLQESELIYADFFIDSVDNGTKATLEFSKSGKEVESMAETLFAQIDPSYKTDSNVEIVSLNENLSETVFVSDNEQDVKNNLDSRVSNNLDVSGDINVVDNLVSTPAIEKKREIIVKKIEKILTAEELYQKEYDAGYSDYVTKDYKKAFKHYKSALVYKNDDIARIWVIKSGLKLLDLQGNISDKKLIHAELSQVINQIDFEQLSSDYKKGYKYLQSQLDQANPDYKNFVNKEKLFEKSYKSGYSMYKQKDYKKAFSLYKEALGYKSDDITRIWAVKSGFKLVEKVSSSEKQVLLSEISGLLDDIDVSSLSSSYKKGYIYLKEQYNKLKK